jgi:hypothetical protein
LLRIDQIFAKLVYSFVTASLRTNTLVEQGTVLAVIKSLRTFLVTIV